jgi:hypothetical protein
LLCSRPVFLIAFSGQAGLAGNRLKTQNGGRFAMTRAAINRVVEINPMLGINSYKIRITWLY